MSTKRESTQFCRAITRLGSQLLEGLYDDVVSGLDRGDEESLLRAVGRENVGTDRGADHRGILGDDDAALQAGVDGVDLWLDASDLHIGLLKVLVELVVNVGFPARVATEYDGGGEHTRRTS